MEINSFARLNLGAKIKRTCFAIKECLNTFKGAIKNIELFLGGRVFVVNLLLGQPHSEVSCFSLFDALAQTMAASSKEDETVNKRRSGTKCERI